MSYVIESTRRTQPLTHRELAEQNQEHTKSEQALRRERHDEAAYE